MRPDLIRCHRALFVTPRNLNYKLLQRFFESIYGETNMTELIYILTILYAAYVIDAVVGDKLVLLLAATAFVVGIIY